MYRSALICPHVSISGGDESPLSGLGTDLVRRSGTNILIVYDVLFDLSCMVRVIRTLERAGGM